MPLAASDDVNGGDGATLSLAGQEPLRTSRNYRIFDHPLYPDALLKVRSDASVSGPGIPRYATWRYGNLRQWNREANEYLAALHRGAPEIDRLARFMGFAPTSEGPALVVERMTGPDGGLAPTLREEIARTSPTAEDRRRIHAELMELMDDLERGRIIVGDLYFDNIVRARERGERLTIIDGLGERVLLPLTVFSRRAFAYSIARRREKLSRTILPDG